MAKGETAAPGERYDIVLFDWDGCLAQTLDIWMRAFRATLADFDLHPSDREIASQFGDWDGPRRLGVPGDDTGTFVLQLLEAVNLELPHVALAPGALALVEALRRHGIGMALVTSSTQASVDIAMIKHGLRPYFDAVVTSDDVRQPKPHPEALEIALARIGTRGPAPCRVVMVGDSANDLGAATNAGVDSVLVHAEAHGAFHDLDELLAMNPTHVCRSFDEVRAVLLPG